MGFQPSNPAIGRERNPCLHHRSWESTQGQHDPCTWIRSFVWILIIGSWILKFPGSFVSLDLGSLNFQIFLKRIVHSSSLAGKNMFHGGIARCRSGQWEYLSRKTSSIFDWKVRSVNETHLMDFNGNYKRISFYTLVACPMEHHGELRLGQWGSKPMTVGQYPA